MVEGLERKGARRFPIPADPWFGHSEGGQSSRGERMCPPVSKAPMRRGGNLIGKAAFAQIEFATDSPLEEAVSESRNSLLAGKIQGNSSILASDVQIPH
jgi:hypothetical protein